MTQKASGMTAGRSLYLVCMRKYIAYTLASLAGISFGLAGMFFLLENGFLNSHYRAFVVQSGSMEPAIKTGSMVFSKSNSSYSAGEVITFKLPKDQVVTHRIDGVIYERGVAQYQTKGDANEEVDSFVVTSDQIIGKVGFSIPFIGYLSSFVRTPKGFVALVVIPASIIVYEEIKKVLKEIRRYLYGSRIKSGMTGVVIHAQANDGGVRRGDSRIAHDGERVHRDVPLQILIPLFGVFLVFAGASVSYFHDSEGSQGNVLSAGSDFGSLPSKTLVINEVLPDSSCSQGQTEAQWLEVYNKSDGEVNLKNFKITDGENIINIVNAGNIILQPNSFALLAHNNAIWNHCFPDNNDAITANLGGDLDIDSGELQLLDSQDNVLDTVIWDNLPAGEAGLGQDKSLERTTPGFDTKFGAEFEPTDFVVKDIPTPGE